MGKIISEVSAAVEAFSKRKKNPKLNLSCLERSKQTSCSVSCAFAVLAPAWKGFSELNDRPFKQAPSAGPG